VRQSLALAADAAHHRFALRRYLEDERLGELGPHVERNAGGKRFVI
jgi:hypothetical protein